MDGGREGDGGAVLAHVAMRIERSLERIPPWIVCAAAVLIGVVKAGPRVVGELPTWDPASWPLPVDYYPFLSYGFRIVGVLTGADSPAEYLRISIVAVFVTLALLVWIVSSSVPRTAVAWVGLVLLSGPIVWVLIGGLGRVDALVVAGAALAGARGRQPVWAALGIVIASLGHPELAVVAALTLLILSLTPDFRTWRAGAITGLVLALAIWLGLRWWALALGQQTRDSIVGEFWRRSIEAFVVHLPLEAWAGFGLGIVLVAWAIAAARGWARAAVAIAVIVPPITLSLVTADQTRVWVLAGVAVLFAIAVRYGEQITAGARRWLAVPLTVTLAAVIVLPAVEIQFLQVRSPWEAVWPYLTFYVFGSGG